MTETTLAAIGPYTFELVKSDRGISKVKILKEPSSKGKNPNTKIVQIENLLDAPVAAEGTEFQRKVWNATRKIPYGETRTYAQIAAQIGHPKAVRAVGTALGKNPVCVIVPCHRVVPSGGGIGQYAYGAAMKRWLLDHEAKRA